jgi:hypothetical protein
MTVVVVDWPERWTHWSKWSQLHPFDQTDISLVNLIHPSCAYWEGSVRDRGRGTGQGRPHLQGRPCLTRVAQLYFSPKCVPTHKNCNTTHGTLLVSKMCTKLVVYSSQTRGFDSRIFVVRTVNNVVLQAKVGTKDGLYWFENHRAFIWKQIFLFFFSSPCHLLEQG